MVTAPQGVQNPAYRPTHHLAPQPGAAVQAVWSSTFASAAFFLTDSMPFMAADFDS